MRTRLSGGLACAVQPPDLATREGIVHLGAQQRGLQLAAGVSHLIAESIVDDARRLHGALNLLMAASRLNGWSEISREDAESTLQETFQSQQRSYRLDEIEQAVCQVFGVDARSLKSDAKAKRVSQPRMLAMWLARKYSRAALSEIGGHFGRRSHSTVISAQKKVEGWLASGATVHTNGRDFRIDEAVRQLETRLRTG